VIISQEFSDRSKASLVLCRRASDCLRRISSSSISCFFVFDRSFIRKTSGKGLGNRQKKGREKAIVMDSFSFVYSLSCPWLPYSLSIKLHSAFLFLFLPFALKEYLHRTDYPENKSQ
jgi:hypothetical protein